LQRSFLIFSLLSLYSHAKHSMDTLPPELVDRISSFLDRANLKHTLLLSPAFQVAAENHSGAFADFHFVDLVQDCESFVSQYSGQRLRYLRNIEVNICFSAMRIFAVGDLPCRESKSELDAKDQLFTKKLRHIFEAIKRAENAAKNTGHGPGRIHLTIFTPYRMMDAELCRHTMSSAWRLRILNAVQFPFLNSIRELSIYNPDISPERTGMRHALSRLDPRITVDLACKLPNLEHLGCRLGVEEWNYTSANPARKHFEHDFEGCARDARAAFADALATAQLPPALREVQLDFFFDLSEHLHLDENEGGPDLVGTGQGDPFSKSLHVLAQGLKRLDLKVKADATLFWPVQGETPFLNLETLNVMFFTITPSGSWYFRGRAGRGAETTGYQITDKM
jgi:hypothetical protein